MTKLDRLLAEVRACRICADRLPLGPRPVLILRPGARLLIAGQAPGTKVHESGIPWNDRSGDRLRDWLGLDRHVFYNHPRIAILPMGFCYPGRDAHGGDMPPRPECAPHWRARLMTQVPRLELVLAVGGYAQRWHLGSRVKPRLWETVAAWREYQPEVVPLPHPSWRNTGWLKRHPWFEAEVVPMLRARVAALLSANAAKPARATARARPRSRC